VEGHGVEPDIAVEDDPALMMNGGDPQLDRAIQEALRLLREQPASAPARPAFEDRSGR
jgi:tricorn protease